MVGMSEGHGTRGPVAGIYPLVDGCRRVQVHGRVVGQAYSPSDLEVYLRQAGLDDTLETLTARGVIRRHGGGPDDWPLPP